MTYPLDGHQDNQYNDEEEKEEKEMDSPWKQIQMKTFTRWCNQHLNKVNRNIECLKTDLSDGLNLITLVSLLSNEEITRYNRKPTFKPQKLENVAIVLNVLEQSGVRVVNIDAGDVVDGNLKLILGLVWTIICRFQISYQIKYICRECKEDEVRGGAKLSILNWINVKLSPHFKVKNFTTDWRDGVVMACLLESVGPGIFPEWGTLCSCEGIRNTREAMHRAEEWLGVPQIIAPEDMVSPHVDELSVMTYLSCFLGAKVKNMEALRVREAHILKKYGISPDC